MISGISGVVSGLLRRAHVFLRGIDSIAPDEAERGAVGPLPVGELLHPGALAAVAVLVLNDWWAKRHHPSWLTGKLSDVAGLVMAPLALSAAIGCGLWLCAHAARWAAGARRAQAAAASAAGRGERAGAAGAQAAVASAAPAPPAALEPRPAPPRRGRLLSLDPSARPRRFAAAIALTGAVFAATKLSASAASLVTGALAHLGFGGARIAVDPTDLFALPALLLAALIARAELRLIARGRVHAVLRGARSSEGAGGGPFADALAAGASPTLVEALRASLRAGELTRVNDALRQLAGAPTPDR